MTTTTISFTKLRDGSWGVRGQGLAEGQHVTVTKKSGETSTGTVGAVVFTAEDGIVIARFEGDRAPARRPGVFASRYVADPEDGTGIYQYGRRGQRRGCHTDGNCSSMCNPSSCPCGDGHWFDCC